MLLNIHPRRTRAVAVADIDSHAGDDADDADAVAAAVAAEVLCIPPEALVLQRAQAPAEPAVLQVALLVVVVPVEPLAPGLFLVAVLQVALLVPGVVQAVVVRAVVPVLCLQQAYHTGCRNLRFLHHYRIVSKTSN